MHRCLIRCHTCKLPCILCSSVCVCVLVAPTFAASFPGSSPAFCRILSRNCSFSMRQKAGEEPGNEAMHFMRVCIFGVCNNVLCVCV